MLGSWLALLLVALVVSLALTVTVAAWRVRRTTPRTVSLVLSVGSCLATTVAAMDCSLPLPEALCLYKVEAEPGALERALTDNLGGWGWWIRPCGRLVIDVQPEDLAVPLDFAKLTAMAVKAGLVVDVRIGDRLPVSGRELELVAVPQVRDRSTPTSTPIPASRTDEVAPRFRKGPKDLTCRIDLGRRVENPKSLATLLGDLRDYVGFHRLQCWELGREELDPPTSSYVRIRASGVVAVGDAPTEIGARALGELLEEDDDLLSLGLGVVEPVRENDEESAALSSASMLILDRPKTAGSCRLAKRVLDRGGTVVVAMPKEAFVEACTNWLPVAAKKTAAGSPISFDRRPRLTFLLDDFGVDLELRPSCVYERSGECWVPDSPDGDRWPRKSIEDVQIPHARGHCGAAANRLSQPAECALQTMEMAEATRSPDTLVPVLAIRRSHPKNDRGGQGDRERIDLSSPMTALRELADARASRSSVYWEEESIVVFTHDPRPVSAGTPEILNYLDRSGSRVYVETIADPYGYSLGNVFPELNTPSGSVSTGLVVDPGPRFKPGERPTGSLDRKAGRFTPLPSPAQTGSRRTIRSYSRFSGSDLDPGGVIDGAAPVQFGWWTVPTNGMSATPGTIASTTQESGLVERPLAIGAMVGLGHLLFLTYSPFERVQGDQTWPGGPSTHEDRVVGLHLIQDLYTNTKDFLAELEGPIYSVVPKPDGALWVTIAKPDDGRLLTRTFKRTGEDSPLSAHLVDFDSTRGLFTYALPGSELAKMEGCSALVGDLGTSELIHACPPGDLMGSATRADAALGFELLASYSGGRVLRGETLPSRDSLHTRALGLGALSILLLIAWGRRGRRRLSGLNAYRRLRVLDRISQRRFDPPDAVVAAGGDWDGPSSTWPRTGSFGGYRTLEPGDRTSAIVLQDLVLGDQGGPRVLPRVTQRIEEAAPSILILVNLGESMRVPLRGADSKARFGGRLSLQLAASAWKIQGEVAIQGVGIAGEPEIIAPTQVSPGREELDENLASRLRERPRRQRAPWPKDLPECGAVVYVSDFQLEDERGLLEWLTRLEGEGIRVGGVMIFSPLEFTMTEGGRLAGSGVWADRADWDPDDVFEAFCRRRDEIERIFDAATTGGLLVVDTSYSQEDVEAALESGRLLQILR